MKIVSVFGQVVKACGMRGARINDMVFIGKKRIIGEVIKLDSDVATILCYEGVSLMKVGDCVENSGELMSAELGPGLIGSIFDGLQRPLNNMDCFLGGSFDTARLGRDKRWVVKTLEKGEVREGEPVAVVQESKAVAHNILSPCDGVVEIKEGEYCIDDVIGYVKKGSVSVDVKLLTKHPLRMAKKFRRKHVPSKQLVTGQRVLDTLFPVAKGGVGAIPGGFGTGKTVTMQSIAKFSDADIIIMTLVGERGNECADVLKSFSELVNPDTGESIMEKSVIIANTSNMPVSARIASVYLGATIGEYYRDMGYDVLMITDSTSRWAEALREVSGSLEEMPGEEGFPVYLASSIAAFYGRAGYVETLGGTEGSLTILGAVSPPGGDFSEPVVQATKGVVRCFWALSPELAYNRHYPAIDWLQSYSKYDIVLDDGLIDEMRLTVLKVMEKDENIQNTVRLVGYESLSDEDKFVLYFAEIFKNGFLQQSAMHDIDRYTPLEKQKTMLMTFLSYYEAGIIALKHRDSLEKIKNKDIVEKLLLLKFSDTGGANRLVSDIEKKLLHESEFIEYGELYEKFKEAEK